MKNLFLLPTDKDSKLYLGTSDETIKDGDWFYESINKSILKYDSKSNKLIKAVFSGFCKKIILTTDKDLIADGVQSIPDEFLEWFVKNPSCESVEVEEIHYSDADIYEIIIPKEEPKQEEWLSPMQSFKVKEKPTQEKDYTALLQPVGTKQESIQILKKAKENALKQETLENIKCTCLRPQVNCFSGRCSYCNRQIVKQLTTEDLKPKQEKERGITITHVGKQEPFKHKVESLSKEEVLSNRSNAYEFINFDKQETLEEVARKYASYNFDSSFLNIDDHFEAGAKWQQEQDKNKYSEEEVEVLINALNKISQFSDIGNDFLAIIKMKSIATDVVKQFKK